MDSNRPCKDLIFPHGPNLAQKPLYLVSTVLNVKFSRTDKMHTFFSRIGTQIWNAIPNSIKLLKRSSFREKIKELLLKFLRSEDDYVEVSHLIKLFNTLD